MKMTYKGLLICCMAFLLAVAFIVPSEAASIRDCVEESGIDVETADQAEIEAVVQECMEAAAEQREEARAERREAREARKAQKKDNRAKRNVRNAIVDKIATCMEEADIDYEADTREDIMAQLEMCATAAGLSSLIECVESIDYEALDRRAAKAELDTCIEAAAAALQ